MPSSSASAASDICPQAELALDNGGADPLDRDVGEGLGAFYLRRCLHVPYKPLVYRHLN